MRSSRLLVPEVVQTSAMDCGPACLKSLLEGFGVPVSYERLREVCQVDLDGTSINTLEQVANDLGLDAEQIVVPVDHLVIPEANVLPALIVVRLPNAFTHFVIGWAKYGRYLQLMDPAEGRQWADTRDLLQKVHVHAQAVKGPAWREWAGSKEFIDALRHRMRRLYISDGRIWRILDNALDDPHWRPLAAVDAAARMTEPLLRSGGLSGDQTAGALLEELVRRAGSSDEKPFHVIPPGYWSVLPARSYTEENQNVVFRGAVALRIRGKRPVEKTDRSMIDTPVVHLRDTVRNQGPTPMRQIAQNLRRDGLLKLTTLAGVLSVSALGLLFEALLFRSFLDLESMLGLPQQRLGAGIMLIGFLFLMLFLDLTIAGGLLRFGRKLEIRVRAHLLEALPRVSERYFSSRLLSDMAERGHAIHEIRNLPKLGGQLIRSCSDLVLTTPGMIWLDPTIATLAVTAMLTAIILPSMAQPLLSARDLKLRTHSGGLCRFYLDALVGLIPITAHNAGKSVRCEHETLLTTWARAGLSLQRAGVMLESLSLLIGFALTVGLLGSHILRVSDTAVGLLLVYWALNIPVLGSQVSQTAWQYPRLHNIVRRVLEPIASAAPVDAAAPTARLEGATPSSGISVVFKDVTVCATGHVLVENLNLNINAGSHVCIVGPSGAGKSSLVGLLLGWNRPSTGSILINGAPLDDGILESLRRRTAWVDPTVHLWNRPLAENLRYGVTETSASAIGDAVEQAGLRPLLSNLPDGLQTILGEAGALVSGGEGQRVRLGRAMMRHDPVLAILDEPFSAMDRETRHALLLRVRNLWQHATLLCVTHDVSDSAGFERVIVMDQGRVVEDGFPDDLLEQTNSLYRQLILAEQSVREQVWEGAQWRSIRLEDGRLSEVAREYEHGKQHADDLLAGRKVG